MRPKVPRRTRTSKALPIANSNVSGDKSFAAAVQKQGSSSLSEEEVAQLAEDAANLMATNLTA